MSELVSFQVDAGEVWDEREMATIQQAALDIGGAIARDMQRSMEQATGPSDLPSVGGEDIEPSMLMESAEAFLKVFGRPVSFLRRAKTTNGFWGEAARRDLIFVYRNAPHFIEGDIPAAVSNRPQFVVHELGHAFENVIQDMLGVKLGRNSLAGNPSLLNRQSGFFHLRRYQQSEVLSPGEIFADMFIGWVYDRWELSNRSALDSPLTEIGQARRNFMAGIMIQLINAALTHNGNR